MRNRPTFGLYPRKGYLYKTWFSMLDRCFEPDHPKYKYYGDRGITICDRWHDFDQFVSDILSSIGERPEGMTFDRIDSNKNYEPGNVRWATLTEQSRNRPNYVKLNKQLADEIREKYAKHSTYELAREYGVSQTTICKVLKGAWK